MPVSQCSRCCGNGAKLLLEVEGTYQQLQEYLLVPSLDVIRDPIKEEILKDLHLWQTEADVHAKLGSLHITMVTSRFIHNWRIQSSLLWFLNDR